jgi:excisionase family DNA binding protein
MDRQAELDYNYPSAPASIRSTEGTSMTVTAKKADLTADGFADVQQAAEFLGLKRSSIYKLMESGDLKYAKFGKARRIPWRALREYGERCLVGK